MLNFSRNIQGRFTSTFFSRWGDTPRQRMEAIETSYENNLLYEKEAESAYYGDDWLEAIKPLRTPVNRSVDFFAAKLLMGTPRLTAKSQAVSQAVENFLEWSNFDGNKRAMLRKFAMQGNLFVKINVSDDRKKIYQDVIDGKNVTDFEVDSRGFLTEIRIDVPVGDGETYTEYWTQEQGFDGYVATWTHRFGREAKLEQLGDPQTFTFLYQLGVDFIPITFSRFKDIGKKWGVSCVDHALAKIDEVNREFTNLAEKVFQNRAYWIVETGTDSDGLALPAPEFPTITDEQAKKMGNMVVVQVPGANAKLAIPDYAWSEFLAIIKSQEEELQQDLPELRYFTLKENELSGIAMRTLLAGALDRAKEASENFIKSEVRAIAMALTMGRFYGIFPASIGQFDNGDFAVSMQFEEIVPASTNSEKATTLAQLPVDIPLPVRMQLSGYNADEIALISPPQ